MKLQRISENMIDKNFTDKVNNFDSQLQVALDGIDSLNLNKVDKLLFESHQSASFLDGVHGMGSIASKDYEEGTWTPTIITANDSYAHMYDRQLGKYVRIDKLVYVEFAIDLANRNDASSGHVWIVGLPFTPDSFNISQGLIFTQHRYIDYSQHSTGLSLGLTSMGIYIYRLNDAGGTGVPITTLGNNARLYGSGFYISRDD